jgi:anti-anti-sigma factor
VTGDGGGHDGDDDDGDGTISLTVDVGRAVVGVGGEVDLASAPMLERILELLAEQGRRTVVVDLAALRFIDMSGMHVLADASQRMARTGRVLTLRSVPPRAQEIIRLSGISRLVHLEPGSVEPALGREEHVGDHSTPTRSSPPLTSADLSGITGLGTGTQFVDAALGLVTTLAGALVGGADGVSVSLRRHGRIATVASSNDTVLRMDSHQYETGEGPCLSAAAEGSWFHIASLADEDRWPSFVPLAVEQGIASILSSPLVVDDQALGAINIYSNTAGAFGPEAQAAAAMLAARASDILALSGAGTTEAEARTRTSDALRAREVIAQAQGVLMARYGLTAHQASDRLHHTARSKGSTVQAQATAVVAAASPPANRPPPSRPRG